MGRYKVDKKSRIVIYESGDFVVYFRKAGDIGLQQSFERSCLKIGKMHKRRFGVLNI